MGYYCEVGIGGPVDVQKAITWYQKAEGHGNADAVGRLQALAQPQPQALSRQEHDNITDDKLVRKRTQAKQRSDANATQPNGNNGPRRRGDGRQVIDVIRKNTLTSYPEEPSMPSGPSGPPAGAPGPPRQGRYPGPGGHAQEHSYSTPVTAATPRPQRVGGQDPKHRYTLSDAPLGPPVMAAAQGGGGRTQSPARLGPGPNPNSRPNSSTSFNNPGRPVDGGGRPGKPGPATFAEMGFQGAKAEDKDCVIM